MPTPLIDYPRPILDFEVKLYTQRQDLVLILIDFEVFRQLAKSYGSPGLFVGTIRHLSTYGTIFSIMLVLLRMTLNFSFGISSRDGITYVVVF